MAGMGIGCGRGHGVPGVRIGLRCLAAMAHMRMRRGCGRRRGMMVPGMRVLRGKRRACQHERQSQGGFHRPVSGPITVTVCIIPPCMW